MKGDEQIIINFNRLFIHELTVANQCFLNSKIFKHLGLIRLSDIEYQEFMDEMKHADCCIQRILFLEGTISCERKGDNVCNIANDVEKILRVNLNLENNIVKDLRKYIAYTDTVRDFVSRDIMINILIDEEKHINFLETEIALITQVGICNYLQSQLQSISK